MSAKDDLANRLRADFDELHDYLNGLPAGIVRRKARRLAQVAHVALNEIKALAVDDGHIEPFSGGDPKPEE